MPRKSTASMASATPAMDTNGEAPALSNAPPTNSPLRSTTKATNTDPISPSKPKSQAHLSKTASERPGRKSAGNAELEEGNVEKVVKVAKAKNDDMTIDDLLLPRSLVSRLSRGSLPPNTSLQKDALLALTKSATVFISYLAHTANSLTSRKTIQAADVLEAIREIELQGIMEARLEEEIQLFDEGVKGKRKGYRDRVKARESTGTNAGQDDNADDIDEAEADGRGPSQSKRIRRAEEDVEMDSAPSSASRPILSRRRDSDETDPSAQLRAEAASASDGNIPYQKGVSEQAHRIADVDTIDPDSDAPDDEDDEGEPQEEEEDEEDDEEEEEDDPEDEDDEEGNEDDEEVDEEERNRRKEGEMLAPNGRVEIGSEDESD